MRSRFRLPHDLHFSCLSHHYKNAYTRALQKIKALSTVRLISLALLIAVCVTACSSGKTNSRPMGIGLRSGAIYDYSYIEGRDGKEYTEESQAINKYDSARFPVFFQFDENLFGNWAYGEAVVDFSPMRRENLPPALKDDYDYNTIINENTTDFDLDSSKTYITDFRSAYPEYASKIDAATNPTISTDCDISKETLGYNVVVRYRQ